MVPPLRQGDGWGRPESTDREMDTMRQWFAALIAAGLLLLFAVPAAAAADCELAAGFATLKALIEAAEGPDKVGACLENEHVNPENGDVLQRTTGGLLVQRAADNRAAFTDGYRTWINGPQGLQARLNTEQFDWEGQADLGTVTVAPGEAIHIRSMNALTGGSGIGIPNQRGVALAIADYGPIKGHAVSMGAGLDSVCSVAGGRAAAESVVADQRQVVGVIGTSCSVAAATAAPIISKAGLVMIAPSTTSPSLTSDLQGHAGANYHPGYYRTANNDLYQAQAVAQFAYNELGLRKVAAIHDGDPYTSGLTGAFATEFRKLGGATVLAAIAKGDTDMIPVLTEIAAGTPDGLFFPLFPAEGGHIVRQVGAVAGLEDVTLIGGAALLVSRFLAVPESAGIYLPGPDLRFGDNTNETTAKSNAALVADYQDRYGEPPLSAYLAHAYDATTLLLRAIETVAVADGATLSIDRAALRATLTNTAGFQGIIGTISCDEFGDCGTGSVQIAHHTDSSITDVAQLPVVYRFAP